MCTSLVKQVTPLAIEQVNRKVAYPMSPKGGLMRFKASAVNFKMAEENEINVDKGKMFYVVMFPISAHQNIL